MLLISIITIKVRRFFLSEISVSNNYSAGIGTYDAHDESVNKSFVGEIKSSISQTIDQGVGTTFDSHVMAGYRFLMRYYDSVSLRSVPKEGSIII